MNDTPAKTSDTAPAPVAAAPKPRVARKTATAQAAAETAAQGATAAAKPKRPAAKKWATEKVEKPAKPVKAAKPVKSAAPAVKAEKVDKAEKTEKVKLVRDSFTIPASEYEVLATLKQRALKGAHPVKKSELLRAGITLLASLGDDALLAALRAVPAIKTGRPKGKKGE